MYTNLVRLIAELVSIRCPFKCPITSSLMLSIFWAQQFKQRWALSRKAKNVITDKNCHDSIENTFSLVSTVWPKATLKQPDRLQTCPLHYLICQKQLIFFHFGCNCTSALIDTASELALPYPNEALAQGLLASCGARDREECSSVNLWLNISPPSNINLGRNAMSQLGP